MSLAAELNNLRIEYETNESVRNTRNQEAVIKATDHFLDTLIRSDNAKSQFEESAREAAGFGKKLVQIISWSGRGPTFLNQSLNDLLDFGDMCARLQDFFDASYGTNEFRVFHYPVRNTRTTALTVSWDKTGFDNADGIIRSNRERAQQRLDHNRHRGGDDNNDTNNEHRPSHESYRPSHESSSYQPRAPPQTSERPHRRAYDASASTSHLTSTPNSNAPPSNYQPLFPNHQNQQNHNQSPFRPRRRPGGAPHQVIN
jgi:hypothetical protein